MNNQLLILGGGFGLYGYLPAAIKANWQVSTLERYRNFLNDRVELVSFVNQITFVQEESLDLDFYGGIVVARNPVEQLNFVQQTSGFKGHYFLEKPIGATPDSSQELLDHLQSRVCTFSIAYLFRYQDWYEKILSSMGADYTLAINWKVSRAKHNSWKNEDLHGGALLSYYGIHLLSLITELESKVDNLEVFYEPDILRINSYESSRVFQIELATSLSPAFDISLSSPGEIYNWSGASPFGSTPVAGFPDPRIPALAQYLTHSRGQIDSNSVILQEQRIQDLRKTISQVL